MKKRRKSRYYFPNARFSKVDRLHRFSVYMRWGFAIILWITVFPLCLWSLRREISLWFDYWTWAAVFYALLAHPFAALGLFFCVGMTLSVLVWQSRNIIWGMPRSEVLLLTRQLRRIQTSGLKHPLWKWIDWKSGTRGKD